jgi:hypothetical protein
MSFLEFQDAIALKNELSITQCLSPSNFTHLPTTKKYQLSPPTNKQTQLKPLKKKKKKKKQINRTK